MEFLRRSRWLLSSYWIAIVYVIREWVSRMFGRGHDFQSKELCTQEGHTAIVTGGSRGIGLEIVQHLLELGCEVIIGSSSSTEERAKLKNFLGNNYPSANVEVWHLDLASLQSVDDFVQMFLSTKKQLHLLFNNAGVMFLPTRELTKDGFEGHFAINYLSHCLLSFLLLPVLSSSESSHSHITNSSSCIHHVSDLDLNDLQGKFYSKQHAYMQSKLAQVMFTYSLQSYLNKKGRAIMVNCAHPGVTNTDLMTRELWVPCIALACFKTAKQGAETIIYAAVSKDMKGIGGKYLEDCAIVDSSKLSRDKKLQNALWNETIVLLKPWLKQDVYEDLSSHLNE